MHEQVLLREKREMLSKSFILMLLPMHVVMASIFIALFRIMFVLTSSVASMMVHFQGTAGEAGGQASSMAAANPIGGGLNLFTNFPEDVMGLYVAVILTILTASNIIVAKIVGGGDRYMYYFYTAVFCLLTGLAFLIIPMIVNIFFNPEALTSMAGPGV
jgi:flagellar protein FlaJ